MGYDFTHCLMIRVIIAVWMNHQVFCTKIDSVSTIKGYIKTCDYERSVQSNHHYE